MCVIAAIPRGSPLPSLSAFHDMWTANPHGAGFMYPCNHRLIVVKGLMSFSAFKEAFSHHRAHFATADAPTIASADVVVHFRIGTHGGLSAEQTHPHPIGDAVEHLALVHNGIMRQYADPPSQSDSANFADFLAKLPKGWWRSTALLQLLADHIGSYNKVVVMGKSGILAVLNKIEGDERDGVWYSNMSWVTRRYSTTGDTPTGSKLIACGDGTGSFIEPAFRPTKYRGVNRVSPDGSDIAASDQFFILDVFVPKGSTKVRVKIENRAQVQRMLNVSPDELHYLIDRGRLQVALPRSHEGLTATLVKARANALGGKTKEERAAAVFQQTGEPEDIRLPIITLGPDVPPDAEPGDGAA